MASFNQVILVGNLTRDPELKYLPSQTAICSFGIAVNEKYRTANGEDRENVLFVDCTAFSKPAETINQYLKKGSPVLIVGKLKLETWDDRQTGQKRSKHSVTVNSFQFLPARDGDGGNTRDSKPPQSRGADRGRRDPEPPYGDEQQFKEDDIPF